MDSLKKMIHPNKNSHHGHYQEQDATTTHHGGNTFQAHRNAGAATDPVTEPNITGTSRHAPVEGTQFGEHNNHRHAAEGAGVVGAGIAAREGAQHNTHNHGTPGAAGVGAGAGIGSQEGMHHGPGVDTGAAETIDARMPAEEGNNFPGTNPDPDHNALGALSGKGLKYPGVD